MKCRDCNREAVVVIRVKGEPVYLCERHFKPIKEAEAFLYYEILPEE